MQNPSPQTKIDLTPEPQMKKVNRSVIYIILGILGLIVGVLAYSVSQPSKVKFQKNESLISTSSSEQDNQQSWYTKVPNSLPTKKITQQTSSSDALSQTDDEDDSLDKESLKKRDEILQSALSSSIKAPDIGSNSSNETNNSGVAQNSFSTATHEGANTTSNSTPDQNQQGEKQDFLQKLSQHTDPDYLHEVVKKPISPYEVKSGTLIPSVLAAGIDSDLPGQLTALVSQNVYDSVSGRFLLIPQGSKLILQYDSHVSYGQERLLVAVKRLILPNGSSLDLDGMTGMDSGGYSGFFDQVDNHYLRIFGSSAMMGLITGGFELSQPQQGNQNATNPTTAQVMASALGQQMGQVGMSMMDKNLDIQPTITIRPGYVFNVEVTKDLIFPGAYSF